MSTFYDYEIYKVSIRLYGYDTTTVTQEFTCYVNGEAVTVTQEYKEDINFIDLVFIIKN